MKLNSKIPDGFFIRGLAKYLGGDLDGGLADASEALKIQSWHADSLRLKTEILEKKSGR